MLKNCENFTLWCKVARPVTKAETRPPHFPFLPATRQLCCDIETMEEKRDFHHPYTPYDIQELFMSTVYQTLEDSKVGILESPTGTVGCPSQRVDIFAKMITLISSICPKLRLSSPGQISQSNLWFSDLASRPPGKRI